MTTDRFVLASEKDTELARLRAIGIEWKGDDTVVGHDHRGLPILAERLQRWAYDNLSKQIEGQADRREELSWIIQTVHQAHHDGHGDKTWKDCPAQVCRGAVKLNGIL